MAMRQGALNRESLGGGNEFFPRQGPADQIHQFLGQMRDVAQGFMLDLSALPIGAAQQMGLIPTAFVETPSGGHMNTTGSGSHACNCKGLANICQHKNIILVATKFHPKHDYSLTAEQFACFQW